jgi:hypothetical protein
MSMKRECLIALIVLNLAGCAATQTSVTPLTSVHDQRAPALLRPDLSDAVTGGIQSRELNSAIQGGR